jgi:phage baseplate assembly protein W
MTGYLNFPYQIDAAGRTATTDLAAYVNNLVLLVLETDPGERVNLPTFGAGLKSLVFAGMDKGLASAAESLVRSKLMQFLGDAININTLTVTLREEQVEVDLTYFVAHTRQPGATTVTLPLPGTAAAPFGSAARPVARIVEK